MHSNEACEAIRCCCRLTRKNLASASTVAAPAPAAIETAIDEEPEAIFAPVAAAASELAHEPNPSAPEPREPNPPAGPLAIPRARRRAAKVRAA
jgi:hypothetical protein